MSDQQKDLKSVIAKVKKLRLLAESAAKVGNQHEADAALLQASRLLERYRIEEAEIDLGDEEEGPHKSPFPLFVTDRKVMWMILLGKTICNHYGVAS